LIEKIKEFREEEEKSLKEDLLQKERARNEEMRRAENDRRKKQNDLFQLKQDLKDEKTKKTQKAQEFIAILQKKNIDIEDDLMKKHKIDPDAFLKQQLKKMVNEKKKGKSCR